MSAEDMDDVTATPDDEVAPADESTAIVGKNADPRPERRARPASARHKKKYTLTQLLIAIAATLLLAGVGIGALIAHYEKRLDEAAAGSAPAAATSAAQQPAVDLARNEPGDPLSLGADDAPVVLVEYSDYRCPFCSVWARETKPALMKYVEDGTLRIEHHELPIFGEESVLAAIAGRAAANQGRFWEFYDAVHEVAPTQGHPPLPKETLLQFAQQVGIPDLAKFEADLSDPQIQADVQADAQQAIDLGASSTPLFVLNGEPIMGAQPAEVFIEKIEQQAAKK